MKSGQVYFLDVITAIVGKPNNKYQKEIIKKYGSKSVGRKKGSIDSDETIIARHSDVAKLLKRGISIRNISAITNKSSNTILKVKKLI